MSDRHTASNSNEIPENKCEPDVNEAICDSVNEIQNKLANYAKDNPFKVIGLSMLAGVVVAQLFRSRK